MAWSEKLCGSECAILPYRGFNNSEAVCPFGLGLNLLDPAQHVIRIEADHPSQIEKLDHI